MAQETATRVNTVPLLMRSLNAKKAYLEERIIALQKEPETKQSKKEISRLMKLLEETCQQLRTYQKGTGNATWASSNTPRFAFRSMGRERAKKEYAPVLGNLRMHNLTTGGTPPQLLTSSARENTPIQTLSAVTRSAAVSDFRHGEVSLRELQDYTDLNTILKGGALSDERRLALRTRYELTDVSKLHSIVADIKNRAVESYGDILTKEEDLPDLQKKFKDSLRDNMEETIAALPFKTPQEEDYALLKKLQMGKISWESDEGRELAKKHSINPRTLKMLIQLLEEKAVAEMSEIAFQTGDIHPEKLAEIIEDRRAHLQTMMLQDMHTHLSTRPASGDTAKFSRLALLDMQKKPSVEQGCVLHERTQAYDMQAIYEFMDGKDVHFDLENAAGPFVDEKGIIHMPKNCAKEGVRQTKIRAIFATVCVQGNTLNTGPQRVIFDEALEKMKASGSSGKGISQLRNLGDRFALSKKEDAFIFADAMAKEMEKPLEGQQESGYLSIDCFGGKDRTGYEMILISHRKLSDILPSDHSGRNNLLKRWGEEMVKERGLNPLIAKDNADHTCLKLQRFDLRFFTIRERLGHLAVGAYLFMKNKVFRSLSVSSTPGQLYK